MVRYSFAEKKKGVALNNGVLMDYQVFISFKNSDENGYTEDRKIAEDLYQYLTAKGIKTFYSNIS